MDEELTIKIGIMETVNHECYVSLEVAKLLKEAGFDWACREYYYNFTTTGWSLSFDDNFVNWNNWSEQYVSAPTLDVAQRWLREVKHCFVNINIDVDDNECEDTIVVEPFTCNYIIEGFPYCNNSPGDDYIRNAHGEREYFDTYEEAQEAGIKKCLTILLKENE